MYKTVEKHAEIAFAYLFGSRARGEAGALSDTDVAVYVRGVADLFAFRLRLIEELSRELKTDRVDVVILNQAPVLLRHEVIRCGRVIKEHREERVPFEAATITEYLDTAHLRAVAVSYLKERMEQTHG